MKRLLCFVCAMALSMSVLAAGSMSGYVKNAPEIQQHSELSKVVQYLIKPYHSDQEKALSILTWIVYNIDYDDYVYRQKDKNNKSRRDLSKNIPIQGDIIQTRLGVCIDIANLYTEMLKLADIEARTITGCNAGMGDQQGCQENPHAWNAVWIEDQWELVDPTFAMGDAKGMQDISSKKGYQKAVKKRERSTSRTYESRDYRVVDMDWFMRDPKSMSIDHQPNDSKWLLLKRKDRRKQY